MIANPNVPAFRYDPYSKKLTRERYNHSEMHALRDQAVQSARSSIIAADSSLDLQPSSSMSAMWGVVLGTLGRQGNLNQFRAITDQLSNGAVTMPHVPILLSELSPAKLALFGPYISTFVQTSCPRLSIDWGYAFDRPLLSPYECAVALGRAKGWIDESEAVAQELHQGERSKIGGGAYPMDFYESGSLWALARKTASLQQS